MDYNEQLKDDITKRVHDRINARMQRRLERRQHRSGAGGIVIGALIVGVGLMILLDNMGIVRFHDVWRYWPVLLIVFGVSRILESRAPAGYIWGGVLTLAGALLLLDNLDIVVFDFNLVWPLLIIAFGLSMLLRSMDRKRHLASATGAPGATGATGAGPGPIDDCSTCNAYAVFGGSKRRVNTPDFRGGDAIAVFGGVEFDLRGAGMTVDQAVIDVNVVCGGLEVRVPDNWTITNRAVTIFGGVEDKTAQSQLEPTAKSPHLVITGSVVFGGISLRN